MLHSVPHSGQDCGSGSGVIRRQQWAGHVRSSGSEDKEGNVQDRRSTLQGVSHQTDGHAEEHQPQLPPLHNPQPREEGQKIKLWKHFCQSKPGINTCLK